MTTDAPALLVVTGLQREAAIATSTGVATLCSGGNPALLRERLSKISPARPRESGDPAQKDRIPAYAGMSGEKIYGILSFGLAGGLAPDLKAGDVVIASRIVSGSNQYETDPNWHEAIASTLGKAVHVHRSTIAGHDTVLTTASDKAKLHATTGAIAIDMESHIAAAFAAQHRLPFAAIRAIGDCASRDLPELAGDALRDDGSVDIMKVLRGLVGNPGQIPALISAGIDSERAFTSLRRSRRLLGPLFGLGGAHL